MLSNLLQCNENGSDHQNDNEFDDYVVMMESFFNSTPLQYLQITRFTSTTRTEKLHLWH